MAQERDTAALNGGAGQNRETTCGGQRKHWAVARAENGGNGRQGKRNSTECFVTSCVSGSTSQAASLTEAVEAGATALLMDDDTGNVSARDSCTPSWQRLSYKGSVLSRRETRA